MADCETAKCTNCGSVYCPECDFAPEQRDIARLKPGLCGLCMESNSFFFEEMRRRQMNGG